MAISKLASVIDTIKQTAVDAKKEAADLSVQNTSPSISTEIGRALMKVAETLKSAAAEEVTYDDLASQDKGGN